MKTKDFIAMLQKEDPSGEGHIRMDGGIPFYAEAKDGYWDGPYKYIDEDNNFVTSTKGYKVDISCIDVEDYVERLFNLHDKDNLEKIKSKFKFELSYSSNQDRIDRVHKEIKEYHELLTQIESQFLVESLAKAIERYDSGWQFFQEKESKLTYHRWFIIEPDGKDNSGSSSQHDTNGIIHSTLFEKLDNNVREGYYQWVKK